MPYILFMKRSEIEADLSRLRNAVPTAVAAFAERRAARVAELEAELRNAPEDLPEPDVWVERALRFARGGDKFGK